jgi:siroheme synthase (precorrin-2 oxidase/ferrochelatase)
MIPSADRPYFAAFLDLRGKPGVVGGGAIAAGKVETLLRSGVRVTVVAPDLARQGKRPLRYGPGLRSSASRTTLEADFSSTSAASIRWNWRLIFSPVVWIFCASS